ncbi:MAG TPA: hypothetical protein VG753_01610 [Candidatus Paceibacterota bacterium]|nr:hypothetical protein [Candidatus Paceibacterota bacterium]
MARVELPASKIRARRRKRRVRIMIALVALVVVVAGILLGLLWAPFARIHTVDIEGASSVNVDTVHAAAEALLEGQEWYVVPRDSVFFYPKEVLRSGLLQQFPVFKTIGFSSPSLTALSISVTERAPAALWCGESMATSSPCSLMDDSGAVYAPAADFSGQVYVQYYGALTASSPKQFMTPDTFQSLTALTAALAAAAKENVVAVEVTPDTGIVHFDSGFVLRYALGGGGADVVERFSLALTAAPFTAHTLSDFDYLDLRFGDRLYYKLKAK